MSSIGDGPSGARSSRPPTLLGAVATLALASGAVGCGADEPAGEPPMEPLFTLAIIADTHISGSPDNEERLGRAVSWINAAASLRDIELVAVLGDIGWGDGLTRSKELLDELAVPYLPLRGDNELITVP